MPDGLKLFKERSASAARREAVLVGNGGFVSSYCRSTGGYIDNSVNIPDKKCSCGKWTLYKFPCACAIAVAMKQGFAPERFVQENCHSSYFIRTEILEEIAGRLKIIMAPTIDQLRTVTNNYNCCDMSSCNP